MFWLSFIGGLLIIGLAVGIGFVWGFTKAYEEYAPDEMTNEADNDSAPDIG